MSTIYPAVTGYKNGADNKVEAEVLNKPINQLRQRTDYLYNQLAVLAGANAFESVRIQNAPLDPDDTPVVGESVYLDPLSRTYKPAIADKLVAPVYPYTYAAETSFSVGLLVEASGLVGTVVANGKTDLDNMESLVETTETFRNGPYYLSTRERGKITATPADIAVYIGYFIKNEDDDAGYAIVVPQLKDMWEAHLHRRFIVASQPAAEFEVTGTDPDDVHYIRGFQPDNPATAPIRMYLLGPWGGTGDVTYTIKIETPDDQIGSARVYWQTDNGSDDSFPGFNDPDLPSFDADYGWTIGRPIGFYENIIPIGTKGLSVKFEKFGDFADYSTTADFFNIALSGVAEADRTWEIAVPDRIKGWLGHTFNEVAGYTGSNTAPEYRLIIFGQYNNTNNRTIERFTVTVDDAGDFADATPGNGVDLTVTDINGVVVGTFTDVTFSTSGAIELVAGEHDLSLWLQVAEYNETGLAASSTTAAVGDIWQVDITDEAPQAKFQYHIEADPVLNAYYPPKPLDGIVLEMNGVVLAERHVFREDSGSYTPGLRTMFWYPDTYASAPYPSTWDPVTPVEEYLMKNMMTYFTHRRVAETAIVTSLKSAAGSPVKITDCHTGENATYGDLEIAVQLDFDVEDSNLAGYKVVKGINEDGALQTGPVVERLKAGSNISLSSTDGQGRGTVTVSADAEGITTGDFNLITLQNAKQEMIPGGSLFSFTKLLPWTTGSNNVHSGFTAQLVIPYTLDGNFKLLFYATVFGLNTEAAKTFAAMKMTYSVLQDYVSPGGTPPENINQSLLTDALTNTHTQNVPFGTDASGYTAYDPFVLHNDPEFTELEGAVTPQFYQPIPTDSDVPSQLTAGDLVALKFERNDIVGGSDEFTGAVGFMRLRWRLEQIVT